MSKPLDKRQAYSKEAGGKQRTPGMTTSTPELYFCGFWGDASAMDRLRSHFPPEPQGFFVQTFYGERNETEECHESFLGQNRKKITAL